MKNKDSSEKYGRNIRVQHYEEEIEEVAAEKIRSIRTGAVEVTMKVSNSQLKKQAFTGERKKKKNQSRVIEVLRLIELTVKL